MASEMRNAEIYSRYVGPLAGDCLSAKGRGQITGLFHHGWYLDCGGQILLLHNTCYGQVPFGIGVDDFETCFPYEKELKGSAVCWNNGVLTISSGAVRVHLRPPKEHTPRRFDADQLRRMASLTDVLLEQEGRGYLRELLPYRRELVRGAACPECVGDLYLTRSRYALESFFRALRGREELEPALRKLIGFGMGLTPSLDDWLVGFLYVLLRRSETPLTKKLCRQIHDLAEIRTNRISAAYLKAAADGLYFEMLQRAGEARCTDDLRSLTEIGGSSGCDMLTGMLFAAAYLEERGCENL